MRELGFGDFLLAGTHGLEFAEPGEQVEAPPRRPAVDDAEAAFHAFADGKRGVLVERKTISVGLHFRGAPQWGEQAGELATHLAERLGLAVQPGKMLVELRPGGADKGSAVLTLMARSPMAGGRPLFIYVKKANIGVTPGLEDFLKEFTSDAATGRGGYLQGRGLIPLPPGQHQAQKDVVAKKTTMARPAA